MSQWVDLDQTGYRFDLTPDQVAAIAPLFDRVETSNVSGDLNSMVIAQIWSREDGKHTAVVAWIPGPKATLMKAALHADGGMIVRVEQSRPEGA